jgi:hypothetical protein
MLWRLKTIAGLGAAITFALASAAQAHHTAAMYDNAHMRTLDGVVRAFNWANPHSTLEFLVGAPGAQTLWTVEMSSPGVLTRAGWTKRSFNPGDKVQIELAPLKDGRPGGLFAKASNQTTGQTLSWNFKAGERTLP